MLKTFIVGLAAALIGGCLTGCHESSNIENQSAAPFTIRFMEMVRENGVTLPKVEIVNQTDKAINGIELEYKCFDRSGRDITAELHKWGITGMEPPVPALFAAKSTNDEVIGMDVSWIPAGTVRITASPVWAKFANGTEWPGK